VKAGQEDTPDHELVIIRRRGEGAEGGHKGGVWKIAYADFMTAMMAFFLVMWLINATNKKTQTEIANYFNPLRLTERIPAVKGVDDPRPATLLKKDVEPRDGLSPGYSAADGQMEQALLSDPYPVLDKLAEQARRERQARAEAGEASAGEAFRDPFDPAFRSSAARTAPTDRSARAGGALDPASPPRDVREGRQARGEAGKGAKPEDAASREGMPAPPKAEQGIAPTEPQPRRDQDAQQKADVAALEAAIKDALKGALAGGLPDLDVKATSEGLLISLTDNMNFGMFAVSSAVPRPDLVLVMEKIAKVLAARPEPLVVRGHTDGRPYRSGTYDNWRLSSARAYVAYSMLVRGGLEEKRFERIEGHADRDLKVADDPNAAQNRRIEILLRRPAS
jgi:chemotaxis protein MotB